MELKSKFSQSSETETINRITVYNSIASELTSLSDEQLTNLLSKAKPLGTSIGGRTALLEICGRPVFVKKIRLTDIERQAENRISTKNLFELPSYLQYGMSGTIGSPGFGAWRELAAHTMTTNWVLSGECPNFPLLYHWREVPRQEAKSLASDEIENIERSVEFWGGLESVRKRFTACSAATTELVLFLEYFPETLRDWLQRYLSVGDKENELLLIENKLQSAISFMNNKGLLHFDVHCGNVMTDGIHLYITDFGLAISKNFDLSEVESNFFMKHHQYDQYYAATYFVRQILKEFLRKEDWEILLREFSMGKNDRNLPPSVSSIMTRHASVVLKMSEFFHKIKHESKWTSYPSLELEKLKAND